MYPVKRRLVLPLLISVLLNLNLTAFSQQVGASSPTVAGVPYFTEPSLSPDRKEIAFVSGGDIWTVPANGGVASLLVSHSANEARPLYSPDGRQLAFISNRTGNGDIYILSLAGGDLKRLTFDDGFDQLDGWSRDGRWIYFSSTSRDVGSLNDLFRVSVTGGTPMQVSADRYTNEFFSAPSPDGSTLAFSARGIASGQWWRKGRSHIDEAEIWLLRGFDGQAKYERVTEAGGAKEMWPMWSADGRNLFYVSDRGDSVNKKNAQNIWTITPGKPGKRLSNFTDGRVLWPNISYDGREIVFERDFKIWKLDTETGKSAVVDIQRRGAAAGPAIEHLRLSDQISELRLSPDGKKVAFVVRGEVFAASSADGGDAARVSNSPAEEYQLSWSPDSRRLVYVSDRDNTPHLFTYDFNSSSETQLTRDANDDSSPSFSPDGKSIAFIRGAKELRVIDVNDKRERVMVSGVFERPPIISDKPLVWSPDSKWIAYIPITPDAFKNINVVSVESGTTKPASFLSNAFSNTLSWSPDGTFLLFDTGQRTESAQLARVDLIPRTPRFREDQFRDLFREENPRNVTRPVPGPSPQETPRPTTSPSPEPSPATAANRPPAPKPVQVVFDGIRRRLSLLAVGLDVNYQTISPDGKWVAMIASAANQANVYIYSIDELSREPAVAKQLTSTPGFKTSLQFSPDSKELYYLENGRIGVTSLEGRPRPLSVAAEMDVDFSREKIEVFKQAWSYLRDNFYDANYHGANWNSVRAEYEPLIAGSRTSDEMRRILQLMVGELNASHLGASAPNSANVTTNGRLGLRFDRGEYETSGRLKITEVIPLGPAAIPGNVNVGDYLLAVDGRSIDASTNLDELLSYKINRRTVLSVASSADGSGKKEAVVRPVNGATERALLYRNWVDRNREYVSRASNGRLGYVHMFDMGSASLAQLYVDLDAENHSREAVVVDIRNNSGGFVNVYAIDVLARRGYLTMTMRGQTGVPARTVLGQRALDRPTILVTNQHSLSDAEDFTEGYRALKLGKVVGEPTAGWIIFTWNTGLVDGTTLRLPRVKITANDGTDMELNPRPVDVEVTRPIGETLTGKDSQLDTAVQELLKQLGPTRSSTPR